MHEPSFYRQLPQTRTLLVGISRPPVSSKKQLLCGVAENTLFSPCFTEFEDTPDGSYMFHKQTLQES